MKYLNHSQAEDLIIECVKINKTRYRKKTLVWAFELGEDTVIETREGPLTAHRGDFLVCNVSPGVSYPWPVKREIFLSTYEVVQE